MSYLPSFQTTPEMLSLVAQVAELTAALNAGTERVPSPRVRRANQIRSVHSSAKIEGNTLSLEEATAVIEGRRVIAPADQIREVRQAFAAYEMLDSLDPLSMDDLLRAHAVMMEGLTDSPGALRDGGVGVYSAPFLIHAGVPVDEVPAAMVELMAWLRDSSDHPLIKGCYFHCAFENIHPFFDGNGRTCRLWHSLINRRWRRVLAWAPVESMVANNQREYYQVLGFSNTGDATLFVEFMLEMVRDALGELAGGGVVSAGDDGGVVEKSLLVNPPSTPQEPPKHVDNLVSDLLDVLGARELSVAELMAELGLSDRKHVRESYLRPAIEAGLVEPTIPDKPRSPRQRYRRI